VPEIANRHGREGRSIGNIPHTPAFIFSDTKQTSLQKFSSYIEPLRGNFYAPPPLRSGSACASGGVFITTIMSGWVSFYSAHSDVFQHF
jgi:hypothetical protein